MTETTTFNLREELLHVCCVAWSDRPTDIHSLQTRNKPLLEKGLFKNVKTLNRFQRNKEKNFHQSLVSKAPNLHIRWYVDTQANCFLFIKRRGRHSVGLIRQFVLALNHLQGWPTRMKISLWMSQISAGWQETRLSSRQIERWVFSIWCILSFSWVVLQRTISPNEKAREEIQSRSERRTSSLVANWQNTFALLHHSIAVGKSRRQSMRELMELYLRSRMLRQEQKAWSRWLNPRRLGIKQPSGKVFCWSAFFVAWVGLCFTPYLVLFLDA